MSDLAELEQIHRDDQKRSNELANALGAAERSLKQAETVFEAAVRATDRRAAQAAAERVADAKDGVDLARDAHLAHRSEALWRSRALLDARNNAAQSRHAAAQAALKAATAEAQDAELDYVRAQQASLGLDERLEVAQAAARDHRTSVELQRVERIRAIRASV